MEKLIYKIYIKIWDTLLVAQLVGALHYKLEGRGFDSRWCHNSSGRAMALGLIQPLTEMCTRNTSLGVKAVGALG